jgi:hypothetical protein
LEVEVERRVDGDQGICGIRGIPSTSLGRDCVEEVALENSVYEWRWQRNLRIYPKEELSLSKNIGLRQLIVEEEGEL